MKYLDLTGLQKFWNKCKAAFVTKDENGDIVVHHVTTEDGIDCEGPIMVKDGNQVAFCSEDNSKKVALRCDDNGKLTLDGKEVATVDDIPSGGSIGDHIEVSSIGGVDYIEFDNQLGNIRGNEDGLEVMSQYELQLQGTLGIEVESTGHIGIISSTEGISINSKNTTIDGVSSIKTINEGIGQAGQVLTTNGETVYWGNASGGDSSIIDLGAQENHKNAQQAMVDYVSELTDEQGCVLFKYHCTCYGNACFAVVNYYHNQEDSYDEYRGTVYDSDRSFRHFVYDNDVGFSTDGCWLPISSFNEELPEELETENKGVIGAINELNSKIGSGSSGGSPMTSITYAELKALRDSGSLVAGMFYRITDYRCTTAQDYTGAMANQFDIIVQALDESTLSETASADKHENDTYFANSNLSAWEIKYCLDNDTTRFAWALEGQAITNLSSGFSMGVVSLTRQPSCDNTDYGEYQYAWGTKEDADDGDTSGFIYSKNETITNGEIVYNAGDGEEQTAEVIKGKGVIYYMKDEFGNECPYDFKNILFKRYVNLENGYPTLDENGNPTWVYTFCGNSYHIDNDEWSELKDGSLESPYGHQSDENTSTFHHNVMGEYILFYDQKNEDSTICGRQYLNNNVFFGYWEEIGSTSPDDCPYYYAYCCYNNKLGLNCYSNTFGKGSNNNTFGKGSNNNTFGEGCGNNTFGANCHTNTFGEGCGNNTFGANCNNNTFGIGCQSNTFGEGCGNNTFGGSCSNNTFGANCHTNTFGYNCGNNTFGANCHTNTFSDNIQNNYFALLCLGSKINGSTNFVACELSNKTLNKSDSFITTV